MFATKDQRVVAQKIMVVDDELGALTLIGIMLERGGFEAIKAHDATMALEMMQAEIPDLFILDIMMPGIDGIELCRRIRASNSTQNVPVLILSARGDNESRELGLEAGANSYLSKPILHHDLITKVKELLGE